MSKILTFLLGGGLRVQVDTLPFFLIPDEGKRCYKYKQTIKCEGSDHNRKTVYLHCADVTWFVFFLQYPLPSYPYDLHVPKNKKQKTTKKTPRILCLNA